MEVVMDVKLSRTSVVEMTADCVAVPVFEDDAKLKGDTALVDNVLGGIMSELRADSEIKGKRGEAVLLHTLGAMRSKRVVVVGLGKRSECDMEAVRLATASLVTKSRSFGAGHVASVPLGLGSRRLTPQSLAQAMAEGAVLSSYTFEQYKKTEKPPPKEFTLIWKDGKKKTPAKTGLRKGVILAGAQNLARDLANEPSSNMTPTILAEKAAQIAKDYGLKMTVLSEKEAEREGMGAFLGVARGTDEPAKLIILRYRPSDRNVLALVGKGITFDSGGISIKPSLNMGAMKADMSGAAAVLGAMRAIAQLKPKIGVMGVMPATENMPSGHAMKPGDVLESMSGQTIEIISTDAEGRLALADAITYAKKLGAGIIVDVATLTGGCVVALGEITSGLISNDDKLANVLLKVSEETGEKMWRMPTHSEYDEQLKSDIADMKNSGGRAASTITAGMFLKKFAGDSRWAHIDIAGKEMVEKPKGYQPVGATGVCARSLTELSIRLAQK